MGLHVKEHSKSKVRLKNLWYCRNQKTKVDSGVLLGSFFCLTY